MLRHLVCALLLSVVRPFLLPPPPAPSLALRATREDIASRRGVLLEASRTRTKDPQAVVDALEQLEKLMRVANKEDGGATALATIRALDGGWRLVFTTGTADTQKKVGRVNYFPLKAVQTFNTSSAEITNAIYVGELAVLKFFGSFAWKDKARKIVFDFDHIALLGLKFRLPKGGAARIGGSTGLGSDNNADLIDQGRTPHSSQHSILQA